MALFPAFIQQGGAEDFPLLGKLILRDQDSGNLTITNIVPGTYYRSQFGNVALIDRNLVITKSSGTGTFAVIHSDGTYENNVNTTANVSKNDIVLWATNCAINISEPS